MLLAYRETPSFFAVEQSLGVHHQTVQRCVERALAYGPLAALDDRPHPGKKPTITPEAKAWLVSLACDKAKDHGYPHELWTTRLLARHARENARAAGHESLANLVQGTVCKILGQEDIKPHKVRYYLENRDDEFEQKMAEVLCIYREVQVLRTAAKSKKPGKPVTIVSTTKNRVSRRSQRQRPICRPSPASTRPSRVIMSTNAMARSACWPESICSLGRSMPWSETATAAESSSSSSSFSMPPIRPALRSS
jgi:transposase